MLHELSGSADAHVAVVRVSIEWDNRIGGCFDLHSIDTGLNRGSGIVHVASNMAKNLGLETQLADSRAVQLGLRRSSR
jgi:hypothetical protein